ncbi:phage protease [Robbsia andropogonis]|uniref:phage protease n=1 Tax=Robbsia andropogonis TaxID=28092 RepID=UPI003D258DAC
MEPVSSVATTLSTPSAAFRIIPSGNFRAQDGRPKNVNAWKMDAEVAKRLIDTANSRSDDYLIDFEHASIGANGPVPAAGWFKKLEWRSGDGLYVTGAKWTNRAKQMINAGEYRYVSPVFTYDTNGMVGSLISVGLTNSPALSGLTDLQNMAINKIQNQSNSLQNLDLGSEESNKYFRRAFPNLFGSR